MEELSHLGCFPPTLTLLISPPMGLIVLLRQTEAQLSGQGQKEIPGHLSSVIRGPERPAAAPPPHLESCSTSFANQAVSSEGGDVGSALAPCQSQEEKRQCLCAALPPQVPAQLPALPFMP